MGVRAPFRVPARARGYAPGMAAPDQNVCSSWATPSDAPCELTYDIDMSVLEDKLLVATHILYNLTFRQWPGLCSDVIRPCAEYGGGGRRGPADMPWWSGEVITGSAPWGFCGCNRDTSCGCNSLSVIRLPRRPVSAINYVKLDGQVLDPTFYRIDDYHKLVYLPGDSGGGWPCCQRLDLPTTEEGTFEIGYAWGVEPPLPGVDAAGSLGYQLYLAVKAPKECRLPRRITNITRQGVTMTMLDSLKSVQDGWTGIEEVDLWIASERFARRNRGAAVYDPERRRAHRRVTG